MEFEIEKRGTVSVASVRGRLNIDNMDEFVRALNDHAFGEGATLAIDISGVEMIDSSGLAAFISLVARARLTEGRVVLVAPSPFVAGIFRMTNLDNWFEICSDLEEATQRLEGAKED